MATPCLDAAVRCVASFVTMTGAYGLLDHPRDDRIPESRLVRSCPMLSIFDVRGYIRGDTIQLGPPEPVPGEYSGQPRQPGTNERAQIVRVRWHDALALPMAVCPTCSRSCYRLHWRDEQWRCRICAGPLVYESRSRNQTVRGHAHAVYLRKRLGVSEILFSPIGARPLRATKWWKLLLELRKTEAALIRHLHDIGDVLEKRYLHDGPLARRYDRRQQRRDDHQ